MLIHTIPNHVHHTSDHLERDLIWYKLCDNQDFYLDEFVLDPRRHRACLFDYCVSIKSFGDDSLWVKNSCRFIIVRLISEQVSGWWIVAADVSDDDKFIDQGPFHSLHDAMNFAETYTDRYQHERTNP